jgi:cysteine desulfurase
MMQLDELGVQVAVGSACSASKDEPSHVLKAIGLSDTLARSSLRFSFGHGTTKSDLKKAAELTGQLVTGNR